ncbi:MAG: IclR family transcriptional regulator [Actinomycetes bacterium]
MPTQPTFIRSVTRALALLEAVGSSSRPVPAKSLARQTALPLPTAYHLLRTLVHEGYLGRTDAGYVLGDRATALAGAGHVGGVPLAESHRVLQNLHDEVRAAAYLSVMHDGEIRLVDVVDSPATPRADLWVGFHDAAHATALGKAVLSTLPEQTRREYVETHELVDLTRHTVTDRRVLLHELDDAAEFALDREEYAVGTACLAVPVPSTTVNAAVAVSVPVRQLRRVLDQRVALRRAARLIAWAGPETSGSSITI